jgi:hypothetical protein
MKKFGRYAVVISGVLGLAASSSVLWAQQDPRTTKQMEEFVAKASTPADHTQLSKHYLEMAAKYKADAESHKAMAASYRRNPGPPRGTPGDPGAHCDRVARLDQDSSAAATELAKYHEKMAAEGAKGTPAPASRTALPMQEAKYPDLLTAKQAQDLVASANTPADHLKLSKHFTAEAASYTAESNLHAAMAAGYKGNTRPGMSSQAVHCDRLAQQTKEAAAAARELATHHQQLAK